MSPKSDLSSVSLPWCHSQLLVLVVKINIQCLNVTGFDTYKTYWLTPVRQRAFHDAEVKKVCEEDKEFLPVELKKHYWETDLDCLHEAYHKWVEL